MILWAMDWQIPESVTGRILQETDDGVPIEFTGELFFNNDVSASYYCSFVTALNQLVEICGTNGSVRLDDFVLPVVGESLKFTSSVPDFAVDVCEFKVDHRTKTHSIIEPSHGQSGAQEVRMFERFSAAVNSGEPEAEWGEYSLKTQMVMDACNASARSDCVGLPV